jgi:hypothetical protein
MRAEEKFGIDLIVPQYEELYKRLLKDQPDADGIESQAELQDALKE